MCLSTLKTRSMKHSQFQDERNEQEKPSYRGAICWPERGSNFRRGSAEAVAAKKVACVALLAQTWARRAVRDFSLVAFQNVTPESRSKEITPGRAPSKVLWTPFEIHDAAERIGSSSIRSIHQHVKSAAILLPINIYARRSRSCLEDKSK